MPRAIIHINVADFAVAVERTVDPRLRKRPVVIAPGDAVRAAVYDMSQEAYLAGVRKGMPLRRARRRCTDAVVIPPHPDRYERAMRALLAQTRPFSPRIEPGEADGHLFLDVTGTRRLFGLPMDVAWHLRKLARRDLGLDPIWSVAPNKLVAKAATRIVKPLGEYIVAPGEEDAFLAPLPLGLVPGIEAPDRLRLEEFQLVRAGQVAALGRHRLEVLFGGRAAFIHDAVRGIDPSPVLPAGHPPPAAEADHVFAEDTGDPEVLEAAAYRLAERIGRDLRRRRRAARRLTLVLDHTDGLRCSRRGAVHPASADDRTLFDRAREALYSAWRRRVRIRRLCLTADRLEFPPAQMELFPEARADVRRRAGLMDALDRVRDRFGEGAVRTARAPAP